MTSVGKQYLLGMAELLHTCIHMNSQQLGCVHKTVNIKLAKSHIGKRRGHGSPTASEGSHCQLMAVGAGESFFSGM